MSLTTQDISTLATLAKINIDAKEVPAYLDSLSNIMNMISEMQKVNTDGIGLTHDPSEPSQRLREDAVTEKDQHALFQTLSENVMAGLYLVPQVIDNPK
jgi:aspartyl-tRNA(Asn)/glutamyl-tRNA(Gln) amidotransferase subunit C